MPVQNHVSKPSAKRSRIKLLGDFCSPEALCQQWNHMSQGQLRWNDIEFTWTDIDVDFYVIINRPWPGEHFIASRSIVFQMEPWCGEAHQHWGVKTWGEWASPDASKFLQVRAHRTHLNNAFWQLKATYDELRTQPIKKTRVLASICSPKYFDPGHIQRVDFLKFLEQKNDDVVRVDLYAHDNPLGFSSWVGPHPVGEKDAALLPYRYFFSAENNREDNFITEKLWESLLTETLCFYSGAPNAADWIDPRAFIPVNLDNFELAFATMKRAILGNEWERRIDFIRREKHKVLEHYQFFPTVERVLSHELKLPAHPTDAEITFHKHFADSLDAEIRTAAFIHCLTRGAENLILRTLLASIETSGLLAQLDRLYVINCGDVLTLPSQFEQHAGRVRLINFSTDASRGECPTLDLVRTFAAFHQNAQILYLHTKGASYADAGPSVVDWRDLMVHFLVEQHLAARAALDANDAVGCNLLDHPRRHFSGNFWWATARYLCTLGPVPSGNRHEAEWWVLGDTAVRAHSLHNSGVDHYEQRYPRSRYAAEMSTTSENGLAPTQKMGTPASALCLVMIVKDEAHVVCEALTCVAPYINDFIIVDTGSSDGTQQVIRDFFAARGLAGQVFDRPWRDFGSNRSEALALARVHAHANSDYLWMFDADDVIEGSLDLTELTADAYQLRLGPDIEYWRLQIFRRALPWRFVGVLHEYPVCATPDHRTERIDGAYQIVSRRLGSRSNDPQKYRRDAVLLELALQQEPENARYAFYLAQSWFDAGEFDKAMAAYTQRASMGGWVEEIFYSRYRVALCLSKLGKSFAKVSAAYEACFEQHPHRAEPLVRAAVLARETHQWQHAYAWAKRAAGIAKPGADALFVERADYEYRALDEQAIAAFYCGHHDEAFALCTELLDKRPLPAGERARIEANRDFSVPHIKDAFTHYDAALVARISARLPVKAPRVTLSITSCKRPALFIATVCSFLNACADIELVDRFICIDDNSSDADRDEMQRLFPFFEFIFKAPQDKGHAKSMNVIADTVRSPWLIHLEDDWHFFARRDYIRSALEILEQDSEIGQLLFNRNYAETLADRGIPGGFLRQTPGSDTRYLVHQHYDPCGEAYRQFQAGVVRGSNAWWPHFSLRPGVWRTSVLATVGRFDESAQHFELDYAQRYLHAGFCTAFFDGVYALHTGRLTSNRDNDASLNAYQLNGQNQFGETAKTLADRHDVRVSSRSPLLVKLVGNWATSAELALAFERQSKTDRRWDDIKLTTDDDADYFVLFNHPGHHREHFVAARSIVFQMEPPHAVAGWQAWARPDPRRFIQVRGHDRFANVSEWHLAQTWHDLHAYSPNKSRSISAIVSSKMNDPGQVLRIGFLRWLEAHGAGVDIYGQDNLHGFRRHLGSLPSRDKSAGLMPYQYTIAVENSAHDNYFTEKIVDALLAECLPFYWGCPNLDTHINPRAFIRLPLNDFEAARRIVEDAIANDEWSQRIEVIRQEKRRLLDQLQLFPTIARIVRGHQLAERLAIRLINLDRRPDRLATCLDRFDVAAGAVFVQRVQRFSAVDGRSLEQTPAIAHQFRGNDFGYRRSVVACALSHMALWAELANCESDTPAYLIFEDDVTLCQGFGGQLVELCAALETDHPMFDVALLGYMDWSPLPEDDFNQNLRPPSFRRFDGARYIGGSFAYIVSRRGAQRLLAIAERDGIQNGIDRFVHVKEGELVLLMATPHVAWSPLVPPGSGLDSDIQNDFEML